MATIFYSIGSAACIIPNALYTIVVEGVRNLWGCLAVCAVCFRVFGTFFTYIWDWLLYLWDKVYRAQLPCSRVILSLGNLLKNIYKRARKGTLDELPPYLKVFVWFVMKIFEIVFNGIEFIGYFFPQLASYGLYLFFWYTIGVQWVLSMEKNPGAVNDTIENYVRMFGAFWNVGASVGNVVGVTWNISLSFQWPIVSGLFHTGYSLVYFVGYALTISPSSKPNDGFDAFEDINAIFSGTAGTTNLNLQNQLNQQQDKSSGRSLFVSSIHPELNDQIHLFRRHLLDITNNPVFTKSAQNIILSSGTNGAILVQTVIVIVVTALEIISDIAFIFFEFILANLTLFAEVWRTIFSLITKTACASSNFECALEELGVVIGVGLYNAFGLNKILGPLNLTGCKASKLSGIPCTCSSEEQGIFTALPPCQPEQYSCDVTTSGNQLYYSERSSTSSYQSTQSTIASLGCPHSFQNNARVLSSKCIRTCVRFHEASWRLSDGWEFEICQGDRYYVGTCNIENNKITIGKRKLSIFNTIESERSFLNKYRSIAPDTAHEIKEKKAKPRPTPPPTARPTRHDFDSVSEMMASTDNFQTVDDVYVRQMCGGVPVDDFKIDGHRFSVVYQKIICTTRAYFHKQLATPTYRKLINEIKQNITLNEDDFFIGTEEKEEDERKPMLYYYITALSELPLRINKDDTVLSIMERFHLGLISSHHEYMKSIHPTYVSGVGKHRGLFSSRAMIITNHVMQHVIDSAADIHKRRGLYDTKHLFNENGENTHGMYRRWLLSNAYNTGSLVSVCGYYGYNCPDGTCAPNGDPRKCKPCQSYTTSCVFKSLPHFVLTGVEAQDVFFSFIDALECWRDITVNPEKSPVRALIKQQISLLNSNPSTYPPNIRFCPGLFRPVPQIPLFTWSWLKFVAELCSENNLQNGGTSKECTCPQYDVAGSIDENYSDVIDGIPYSIEARLLRGSVSLRYMISSVTPGFVSTIWIMLTSLWWNPQIYPGLVNAFNYEYNSYGLTEAMNIMCIGLNAASLIFTWMFFLFPAIFIFVYGRKFFISIASLFTTPCLYLILRWFDYLADINDAYVIASAPPNALKEPNDAKLAEKMV